ncbi:unnamed protein product, partial [Polarella glacialis]
VYLTSPTPVARHAGGFVSHHDCRPADHPDRPICPQQVFHSYGAWFQAHQPTTARPTEMVAASKSGTYWPYGVGVTCLTGTESTKDVVQIDDHRVTNCVAYRAPLRPAAPPSLQSQSQSQSIGSPSSGRGTPSSPTLRMAGAVLQSSTLLLGGNSESLLRLASDRTRRA